MQEPLNPRVHYAFGKVLGVGTPFMRTVPCHTIRRNNKGEYNGIMIGPLPLVASKRRAPLAVLPARTMKNIYVLSPLELVVIYLHLQLFLLQLFFLCRESVEQFKSLLPLLLTFFLVFFTFQWNYQILVSCFENTHHCFLRYCQCYRSDTDIGSA